MHWTLLLKLSVHMPLSPGHCELLEGKDYAMGIFTAHCLEIPGSINKYCANHHFSGIVWSEILKTGICNLRVYCHQMVVW